MTTTITADFVLPAGQTLTTVNEFGLYVYAAGFGGPSLDIEGVISMSLVKAGVGGPAIYLDGGFYNGSSLLIGASGAVQVTSVDSAAGIFGTWFPNFINRGTISVSAKTAAFGISSSDTKSSVENDGLIQVTSDHSARAVFLNNHSDLTNHGTIQATGGDEATIGLEISRFDVSITNTGLISALDNAPGRDSIAVLMHGWLSAQTFTNSGTIKGDIAISAGSAYAAVDTIANSGAIIGRVELGFGLTMFQNSGHVFGSVDLGAGDDTYNGAGGTLDTALHGGAGDDSIAGGAGSESFLGDAGDDTISGAAGDDTLDGGAGNNLLDGGAGVDVVSFASATSGVTVDLQAGTATHADGQDTITNVESVVGSSQGDVLHGRGADTIMAGSGNDTITDSSGQNYLRGEDGDDSISGGVGFDDANGNMGNDTVHGNGGDDYSVGGKDNDLLFGDDGVDIVWGNLGADTCDGGNGDDQCRGGQGDDSVSGGAGNDFISGDRGNDTVAGGAGADLFHTFSGAGLDKVLDFHLSEGDRVMLDPGTMFSVTQVGADTVIDMGAGDQMILVGVQLSTLTPGWIFGA